MAMDAVVKVREHFGTIPKMMTKIKATKLKYDTEVVELSKELEELDITKEATKEARIVKVLDLALDDYKGNTCKGKVNALAKESGSDRQYPKLMVVLLLFSTLVFF